MRLNLLKLCIKYCWSLILWTQCIVHVNVLRVYEDTIITSFAITLYGQCCRRHVVGQPVISNISVHVYRVSKNCAKLLLPELRQISIDFDNVWQKDGKEAKIMRDALIFHLT